MCAVWHESCSPYTEKAVAKCLALIKLQPKVFSMEVAAKGFSLRRSSRGSG